MFSFLLTLKWQENVALMCMPNGWEKKQGHFFFKKVIFMLIFTLTIHKNYKEDILTILNYKNKEIKEIKQTLVS